MNNEILFWSIFITVVLIGFPSAMGIAHIERKVEDIAGKLDQLQDEEGERYE